VDIIRDLVICSIIAILSISALEIVALLTGLDGAYFLPVVATISGLAGYVIKDLKEMYSQKLPS
jgi:hypothetical protein